MNVIRIESLLQTKSDGHNNESTDQRWKRIYTHIHTYKIGQNISNFIFKIAQIKQAHKTIDT